MSPPSPPSVVRPEKPPPSFKYVQRLREIRVGGGDKNGDSRLAAAYLQPPVIVEAGGAHRYSIILLHGLGNRGSDFLPILHSFSRLGIDVSNVRFVFPNAPRRTMQWPLWGPSRGVQAWYTYFSDESGKSSADADEIATSELDASAAALLALAEAEARLAEIRRDSPSSCSLRLAEITRRPRCPLSRRPAAANTGRRSRRRLWQSLCGWVLLLLCRGPGGRLHLLRQCRACDAADPAGDYL